MAASIAGPLAAKQGDLDGKRAAPEPFETVMKMIRPPFWRIPRKSGRFHGRKNPAAVERAAGNDRIIRRL